MMKSFVEPGTDKIIYTNDLKGHNIDARKLGHMNRLKIDLTNADLADSEIWIESMFNACPVFHVSIDGFCYPRARFGYLKSFEIDNGLDTSTIPIEIAPEFLFTFGLKLDTKDAFSTEKIVQLSLFEDTEFKLLLNVTDEGEYVQLLIQNPFETEDNGTKTESTSQTIRTTDAVDPEFKQLANSFLTIFNPRERLDTSLASKIQLYSLAFTKAEIEIENGTNNLLYDVVFGYNNMILSKFLWTSPKAKG